MSSLYKITDDIKALEQLIEEATTGEDGVLKEPSVEDKTTLVKMWEELEGEYEGKAERILKLRSNLIAFSTACKAEEERIYKRRKTAENKVKALMWLLEDSMHKLGAKKITAGTFTLSIQKNPPFVFLANINVLPDEYWRVVPEQREPDKRLIMETLKSGRNVPGAMLSQDEGLRVR
jgi:hypothetical protein